MGKFKLKNASWYPNAVAICIGVILFVLLMRFPEIWRSIKVFVGYFKPVILGCVVAYIVNPLANFFEKLFKKIKKEKIRRIISNTCAFLTVLCLLSFGIMTLIPEIVKSVQTFAGNFDGYLRSFNNMLESWGVSKRLVDINTLISSSEVFLSKVSSYISENMDTILATSTHAGKGLFEWVIALILSIYLIAEKQNLKAGLKRILRALCSKKGYETTADLLKRCDKIFNRYIVYSIIDALIIGISNALIMSAFGMQYIGLISFVVAVTNLIPTFGPFVGGAVGGFILLIVNPMHALIFVIVTLILQLLDGYVIKPRLFGNSLGVSGLWILIGVVVGGNMFSVIGILLAIPCVAVIDLIYKTYFIPLLDKKTEEKERAAEQSGSKETNDM